MEIHEIQIWQLWSTASIAMALRAIASILLFWLTLRIANNIRTSGEENLIAKLLTTALGGFVIFGLHFWQTTTANIFATRPIHCPASRTAALKLQPPQRVLSKLMAARVQHPRAR